MAVTVSVVICSYTEERWDRMAAAVESAMAQTAPPLELIVVVDHDDDLLARVATAFPAVRAVANAGSKGLSDGRNTGVSAARGSVVAFLDDDAEAAPDWLANLARHYERPEVVGVGGAVEPIWPSAAPAWFPPEFNWVVGCSYQGLPETVAPVRNLIGANMSFRRSVFEAVGGFDARLGRVAGVPAGCEETELCVRAGRLGGVVLYDPEAQVAHHVDAARVARRYFRSRCYNEGLSKAVVTRLAGSVSPLSVEARYVTGTLPAGARAALGGRFSGVDPAGGARVAAMVDGLAHTAAGYLVGVLRSRRAARATTAATSPVDTGVVIAARTGALAS